MPDSVIVAGNFPPPIDGQKIATAQLANLLEEAVDVRRVDMSPGSREFTESRVLFRPSRAWHYLRAMPSLRQQLKAAEGVPVLWTSVSPTPLGHLRDRATVLPALTGRHQIYGVIHWGNFERLFQSRWTRRSARTLVEQLTGFVFLTRDLSERCSRWIPAEKRFVVCNTIDDAVICTDEEVELKRKDRGNRSSLHLLFLSNMTPSKGFMDVLHATRLLLERGYDVTTDFVGQWETNDDREQFFDAVERHSLDSQITHHEAVSHREQIKALHLQADVFVLPTYYPHEAQPLTIIEALNAGTPVVTTRHAGIPEMIDENREGLFVPARDPTAIVDAVENVAFGDSWKSYSRAARRRFNNQFSPASVREKWVEVVGDG